MLAGLVLQDPQHRQGAEPEAEREQTIERMRTISPGFGEVEEQQFRMLLARVRKDGFALRAPHTEPRRNTTVAVPLMHGETVLASITVSFFTSAVPRRDVADRIIAPLRQTVDRIEKLYTCMRAGRDSTGGAVTESELADYGLTL